MYLWIVLLAGVVVVVGGVLVLRLHAFLALLLAALVVSVLTPSWAQVRYDAGERRIRFEKKDHRTLVRIPSDVAEGQTLLVLRPDDEGKLQIVGRLRVAERAAETSFAVAVPADSESQEPVLGDLVLRPSEWAAAQNAPQTLAGERIAKAFGSTAGSIGILIAMAAIIGKCLLDSGSADRIVRSAMRLCGEKGAPGAFLFSGFLLGIPVFFDTVFYLMIPLGKALRLRTGRNYLLYILSIVAGATMAHSLVPPTPGPLIAAKEFNVDLGTMIATGTCVGLVAASAGFAFALIVNRRFDVPLRGSADFSLEDVQKLAARGDSELPPLWLALAPILLPVILIAGQTAIESNPNLLPSRLHGGLAFLGDKNIAITLGTVVALLTLAWQRRTGIRQLADDIQAALASGGVIILITSAGGAFGASIRQTGLADWIGAQQGNPVQLLVFAFLITMAIRTAQGSATVAMITAASVMSGLASAERLGFHPVYLAMAVGCGSKPLAWMNDSGFWVICKMSGMTESEGLRFVTPMSLIMGVSGLLATIAGALLFPMR